MLAEKAARGLLAKFAEEQEKKKRNDSDVKKEVGISPGLAGLLVQEGAQAANPLGNLAATLREITRDARPFSDMTHKETATLKRFLEDNGFDAGNVSINAAAKGDVSGVRLSSDGKARVQLQSPSLHEAFHELGHAKVVRTPLGRGLSNAATVMKGEPGSVARMLAGAMVLGAPPDENTGSVRRFLYNAAPALVGATFAPELLEEAMASYHALKGAKKHGLGIGAALKELGPGYGTYMASAAVPVIATILAGKVVRALYQRAREKQEATQEGEEKLSAPMAGREVQSPGGLRVDASAAWRVGGTPSPPKSTPVGGPSSRAKETPKARLPSNVAYHKDTLASMASPARGARLAR